jgi:hypothetical protein
MDIEQGRSIDSHAAKLDRCPIMVVFKIERDRLDPNVGWPWRWPRGKNIRKDRHGKPFYSPYG